MRKRTIILIISLIFSILLISYFRDQLWGYMSFELFGGKKDCKSDIECFKKNAKMCTPTTLTIERGIFGFNASISLEISGFDGGKCVVRGIIAKVPVGFDMFLGRKLLCRFAPEDMDKDLPLDRCEYT